MRLTGACTVLSVILVMAGAKGTLASEEAEPPSSSVVSGYKLNTGELKDGRQVLINNYMDNLRIVPGVSLDDSERSKQLVEQDKRTKNVTKTNVPVTQSRDSLARENRGGYPFGWCTYYVSQKKEIPSGWGNASSWLNSAREAGYETGSIPKEGAIIVTAESRYGHVAYVEEIKEEEIVISEMNGTLGWGKIDKRILPIFSRIIRGYIYI